MGKFLPLLTLTVQHAFFLDALCARLEFLPTRETQSLIERAGIVVRGEEGGIRLFYEEGREQLLEPIWSQGEGLLSFRVFSRDPLFMNYTRPPVWGEEQILCFGSGEGLSESGEAVLLHRGEYASASELRRVDDPEVGQVLAPGERLVRPSFLVFLPLQGGEPGERSGAVRFLIRFQARETYWKYFFPLELAGEGATISDRGGKVAFESLGEQLLANRRKALVFRSAQPLPLAERPDYSFQLREGGGARGRILIRRLPVPSARQLFKEIIDGNEADISEVYVNC